MRDAPKLLDRLRRERRRALRATSAPCSTTPASRYELDPTLVRGMDYYTRTVFEFTSDELGAQSGVGGGGRYDGLIELLDGPPTPACGWAAGVERMLLAARRAADRAELVDLFVALAEPDGARTGFELAREARRAGLQAQLELAGRSLKGQLKHADRIGARLRRDHRRERRADAEGHGVRRAATTPTLGDVIPAILRGGRTP